MNSTNVTNKLNVMTDEDKRELKKVLANFKHLLKRLNQDIGSSCSSNNLNSTYLFFVTLIILFISQMTF